MGVGGNFWDMLKPHARHEGFGYLRNKRVAVDLSYWIVQHETAIRKRANHARNPHLRLTFFRTINLFSKFGAFPLFVVDGTPSPLKSRARIARFLQASGIDLSTSPVIEDGSVSVERNKAFTKCVRQCVELLELLGIPVLQAKGEAEALCAQLNNAGYVAACITADSDAFLYGANCVIKTIHPNKGEPIECYHMADIEAGLGLKRKQLIAIALLVGTDHNLNGVESIGLETAVRYVKCYDEEEILDRLAEIQNQNIQVSHDKAESSPVDASPKPRQYHCSLCGHPGSRKAHSKSPCNYCKTDNGQGCVEKAEGFKCNCSSCNEGRTRKEQKKHENWKLKVFNKIASGTYSLNHKIIMEMYLSESHGYFDENDGPCLLWERPKLELLIDFLVGHQHWEPSYIRQKLLVMLSTIYLREVAAKKAETLLLHEQYEFDSIQRVKMRYGHQFFVVKWRKSCQTQTAKSIVFDQSPQDNDEVDECDDDLLDEPDVPVIHVDDGEGFLLTDEDIELVRAAFPEEVDRFLKDKELKESKRRKSSGSGSPKPRGLQLSITKFYRSTKPQCQAKPEEDDTANGSPDDHRDRKGKQRKPNTSNLSKSVRRRLLFN